MSRRVAEECDVLLARARGEAEGIVAEARRKAQQQRKEALARAHGEMKRLADRARELGAIQAEQETLTMEQAVADEVLQSVRSELEGIAARPDFGTILDALLAELAPVAPPDGLVLAPTGFGDRCRAWLRQNGHSGVAVEESGSLRDGVAVQDRGKTFRITNTLSSRFNKLENEARKACIHALFGQGKN
jgi:V/A-type H+-transporting ATPase subunit E